jgi:hypothetical protein
MAVPQSLVLRKELFKEHSSEEVLISLVKVTNAALDEPVLLSSDPTKRLSVDPLVYGTVSNGETYQFLFMSAIIPDDTPGSPRTATIVFEDLSGDIGVALQSLSGTTEVELSIVMASTPDVLEAHYTGLRFTTASGRDTQISLQTSRKQTAVLPWPSARMTAERFPGIHR